ncbi:MAG: hypothetical protein Q9165_007154 [Trypethelium subeluteriae]
MFEAVVKEYTARIIQLQSKSRVFCNIPFPRNRRFVGRDEQLKLLHRKVASNSEGQKVAISGQGGIGKTQIVLELAYRVQVEAPECSIFWIPAIKREGLEQTYTDIVQELRIPGWEEKGADSKALLRRYLSQKSNGRWLLIFDNADDIGMWLGKDKQTNPLVDQVPMSDSGSVIFTTRNSKLAVKLAHQEVHTVADADETMARQLLEGYLIKKHLMDNMQQAASLLKELTFLPLAIVQAAAYINENDSTLAGYLGLLAEQEEDKIELLSENFEDEGRYRDIKNPVAATWLISFERMRDSDNDSDRLAADYLSFMACVEPTDIPQSMLPTKESRLQKMNVLGLLKAYSFVVEKTAKRTLDMHRLVHLATRNWLRKENNLIKYFTEVRQHLSDVFPDDSHTNRSVWRLYVRHARCVLGYETHDKEEVLARGKLLSKLAGCLYKDGKDKEAEIAYADLVKAWEGVLGEEHPSTLESMNSLSLAYSGQGRLEDAEVLQLQVMEIRKRTLSEEHPDTLISMADLAATYSEQGRWKEAEMLQIQVSEMVTRVLGEEHPDTLSIWNNLAFTYSHQGRWKGAEELETRMMDEKKRLLGVEHPRMLNSINNLAVTLRLQGRGEEAIKLMEDCVRLSTQSLGASHPHTLSLIEEFDSWK